jgi:hypothetical protein
MRIRRLRMKNGGEPARSVLEGQSAAAFDSTAAFKSASRRRAGAALWRAAKAEGLAQSKTGRMALALCLLTSAFCLRAQAQYTIDWYKVSGGGGTSTGGMYQVSGTIGQHDAGGPMTGGSYSLTGGFWALISVVQTPGAPTLYITVSGNTVTVYWQNVSGWSLQQNSNLAVPAGWTGSSGVTPLNGTNYLTVTSPAGNLFFRLSNP